MLTRLVLLAMALSSLNLLASSSDDWSLGITAFDRGDYKIAASHFEAILEEDPAKGHVLYNLGNAYFKQGRVGAALAAYYGARPLLPRDPDLKANISFVEKKVSDQLEAFVDPPFWRKSLFWTGHLSFLETTMLSSLVFGLGLGVLGLGLWVRQLGINSVWLGSILLVVAGILGGGGLAVHMVEPTWGAVDASSTEVFAGPNVESTQLFKLNEGAPIMIQGKEDSWVKVVLSDGKQGWLPAEAVKFFDTKGALSL